MEIQRRRQPAQIDRDLIRTMWVGCADTYSAEPPHICEDARAEGPRSQ